MTLIKKSAKELVAICDKWNIKHCYLTPVGCRNGHLNWNYQVKPILEQIFDDRFIIVFHN